MDENLIDFLNIEHHYPSPSPPNPLLRANLLSATFDDASYPSSTIPTEVPCVSVLDNLAPRTTNRFFELSIEEFDDAIVSVGPGPVGFRKRGNTTLSPGLSPDGVNNLHTDSNVWLSRINAAECGIGSSSALQDTHTLSVSSHNGVAGNTKHCSFNNLTTFNNLHNLDESDSFFDPSLGQSSSATPEYGASGFGDLRFLIEPNQTSFESTEFGSEVPNTVSLQQNGNQPLSAKLPGSTDVPCSILTFVNGYQPTLKPSGSPGNYTDTYNVNSRGVFQCTSFNGMAPEPMHDEKPVVYHKRRKPRSRTRKSLGDETFSCSVCTTFSGDVPSLIEHMRCHNRSHVCRAPGCTHRFSTSRDLTRHTKSAHSNTILTCPVCFAVIKGNRVDNLKRHIRNRHPAQAMAQASPSDYSARSSPGDYTSM